MTTASRSGVKTRVWIRPRSSSDGAVTAPFSRMRLGSRIESFTSVSTSTVPATAGHPRDGLLRPAPDELRVLARAEREALRRDVDGLEQVRLARAVGAGDEDEARLESELEPGVRPDVAERDVRDDQPACPGESLAREADRHDQVPERVAVGAEQAGSKRVDQLQLHVVGGDGLEALAQELRVEADLERLSVVADRERLAGLADVLALRGDRQLSLG